MREIKFNVVKSKNIGTGKETDIPAIKGEGINYDAEINQLADEIEEVNTEVSNVKDTLDSKADKNEIPTNISELQNDTGFITTSALPTKVSQLQNDSNFITSSAIPTNVSAFQNDANYATKSELPTVDVTKSYVDEQDNAVRDSIPTSTSQLTNDSDFATKSDIPAPYDDTELKKEVSDVLESLSKLVSTEPQELTDAQKAQARDNIGVTEGGSNVTMSDNPNGGVDLDVEGTTRTLAKQETIDGVVAIEQSEEVDEIDVVEPSDIANIQLQLGNVFGEIITYTNITIDGVRYDNANVKIQTLTVSNINSKDETEKNNAFSLAQMISTDNTTLKNKFVTGRALLCYQTSDGSASGWKSFYFDSETPPIVVDKIYDQSLTLEANANLNLTIPSKAGYTAIGLGVCYCGGGMSYSFLMDTETRVFIKNITTRSQTLQTRVSIIYARK